MQIGGLYLELIILAAEHSLTNLSGWYIDPFQLSQSMNVDI